MGSFITAIDNGLKALVKSKFSSVHNFEDKDVVFYPHDVAQREVAEKRGKNESEFINIWRTFTSLDKSMARTSVARDGLQLRYSDGIKTGVLTVKSVPVKLKYTFEFWSLDLDKVNEFIELYCFWRHNVPLLVLEFSIDDVEETYPVEFFMSFDSVNDLSPIAQKYNIGMYYNVELPVTVEAWIFDLFILKTIKRITISVYDRVKSADTLLLQETLIVNQDSSGF